MKKYMQERIDNLFLARECEMETLCDVFEGDGALHVLPLEDPVQQHELNSYCWCNPILSKGAFQHYSFQNKRRGKNFDEGYFALNKYGKGVLKCQL